MCTVQETSANVRLRELVQTELSTDPTGSSVWRNCYRVLYPQASTLSSPSDPTTDATNPGSRIRANSGPVIKHTFAHNILPPERPAAQQSRQSKPPNLSESTLTSNLRRSDRRRKPSQDLNIPISSRDGQRHTDPHNSIATGRHSLPLDGTENELNVALKELLGRDGAESVFRACFTGLYDEPIEAEPVMEDVQSPRAKKMSPLRDRHEALAFTSSVDMSDDDDDDWIEQLIEDVHVKHEKSKALNLLKPTNSRAAITVKNPAFPLPSPTAGTSAPVTANMSRRAQQTSAEESTFDESNVETDKKLSAAETLTMLRMLSGEMQRLVGETTFR